MSGLKSTASKLRRQLSRKEKSPCAPPAPLAISAPFDFQTLVHVSVDENCDGRSVQILRKLRDGRCENPIKILKWHRGEGEPALRVMSRCPATVSDAPLISLDLEQQHQHEITEEDVTYPELRNMELENMAQQLDELRHHCERHEIDIDLPNPQQVRDHKTPMAPVSRARLLALRSRPSVISAQPHHGYHQESLWTTTMAPNGTFPQSHLFITNPDPEQHSPMASPLLSTIEGNFEPEDDHDARRTLTVVNIAPEVGIATAVQLAPVRALQVEVSDAASVTSSEICISPGIDISTLAGPDFLLV